MVGHGSKFGRKKEEAIAALLSQRNIEEAARSVGIGSKTLLRWLRVLASRPPTEKLAGMRSPNRSLGYSEPRARRFPLC